MRWAGCMCAGRGVRCYTDEAMSRCGVWLAICSGVAVSAVVFVTGIGWGLPSRRVDPFLFGGRPAWPGQTILELAPVPPDDPARGADVDVNPITHRDRPVCVNDTDRRRAEIVRRYRLASYQPDEIITFMALASMEPGRGRLDPKLYQYGGLWIYPVGALLKLASWFGAVTLRADPAYYLDHPEQFGRFYVVARLYAAAWGLVGAGVVFWITRRLAGGCVVSATGAALCYAVMPVVVNMAHEAKPHLPGAVLMLAAVAAGMRYLQEGGRRWWFATSCLCGAAVGMVLSAWPIFVIVPLMVAFRRCSWRRWLRASAGGTLIGIAVYLLTNPYIAINLLTNRAVLRSNFGNSLAMYEIARLHEGCANAARLMLEGVSVVVMLMGVLSAGWLVWTGLRRWKQVEQVDEENYLRRRCGWLLAAPAIVLVVQFCALAAGKPPEYARFALFADIAVGIGAFVAIQRWCPSAVSRGVLVGLVVAGTSVTGLSYVAGFVKDCGPQTSRLRTAEKLQELQREGFTTLGVLAEPAPYGLPPVNLFGWRILLMPQRPDAQALASADVLIRPWGTGPFEAEGFHGDDPSFERRWGIRRTPISWADKPFQLLVRRPADVVE